MRRIYYYKKAKALSTRYFHTSEFQRFNSRPLSLSLSLQYYPLLSFLSCSLSISRLYYVYHCLSYTHPEISCLSLIFSFFFFFSVNLDECLLLASSAFYLSSKKKAFYNLFEISFDNISQFFTPHLKPISKSRVKRRERERKKRDHSLALELFIPLLLGRVLLGLFYTAFIL